MQFPIPEYHHHEEFQNRSRKLKEIRELGIDPYPPKFVQSQKAADAPPMPSWPFSLILPDG